MLFRLLLLTLTFYALCDRLGSFYYYYFEPPSNETESIRMMMTNSHHVHSPTKHKEGFLCMAYFGDLTVSPLPPTCPEGREEMLYGVQKPLTRVFRLCCFVEYKIDQRQCGGLIPCGPSTTHDHCTAPDAPLISNMTMELGYRKVPGAPDFSTFEDEESCCIWGLVHKKAGSTLTILAHELMNVWRRFLIVGDWTLLLYKVVVLLAIFLPTICIVPAFFLHFEHIHEQLPLAEVDMDILDIQWIN